MDDDLAELTPAQHEYLASIKRRAGAAGASAWARAGTVHALWLVVVLAGAGIPLNGALGGPSWVEPSLGFVIVAAAGADKIFARTRHKAAAVDTLRRSLNKQLRLMSTASGDYAGLDDPPRAFAKFVNNSELLIDQYDQQVIEQNKQFFGN